MPDPNCLQCGGTGYVVLELKDGLTGATRCECFGRRSLDDAIRRAGIPLNYWHDSLDNFELPPPASNPIAYQAMAGVMVEVRSYARSFPAVDKPGLLLVGDTGTGKTHLAVAVLKIMLDNGHNGVFYDYQNLLDRIRASYDETSGGSDKEIYREALETEILLLDDLGSQRTTDWAQDIVTSLITYRCNHQLPLLATTNLPDADMGTGGAARIPGLGGSQATLAEKIGGRARSRLFEMCRIIRMPKVGDYRVQPAR